MILCTDNECRFVEADLARLRNQRRVRVSECNLLATLLPLVVDAEVIVASCFAQVPEELIDAGHRLRGIVKYG